MSGEEIKIGESRVILNEGEELCEECEGKKYIQVFVNRNEKMKLPCGKCGGTGKVDWIQKATGIHATQEFPEFNDSSSSVYVTSTPGFIGKNIQMHRYNNSFVISNNNIPSSGLSVISSCNKFYQIKSTISTGGKKLCLASRRSRNMVKSIWGQINSHLMNPTKLEIVKILKSFKMAIT